MTKKINEVLLTSYALGELPDSQRKEIEMELDKNPELKKEVELIKEMASSIESDMKLETKPRLSDIHRDELLGTKPRTLWMRIRRPLTWSASFMFIAVVGSQLFIRHNLESNLDRTFSKGDLNADSIAPTNFKSKRQNTMNYNQANMKSEAPSESLADSVVAGGYHLQPSAPIAIERNNNTESYEKYEQNAWNAVLSNPLSTFSIDVDTASYSNARRFLMKGRLPVEASVRIEEFINYFDYSYEPPKDEKPFSVNTEVVSSPWHDKYKIVKIGLKGKEVASDARPKSNLVFLLDTSGSMHGGNKLPLLKQALKLLVTKLGSDDRISIITYAGSSGTVLSSTPASKKATILQALENLRAGGGTNGEAGIKAAYREAKSGFIAGGINRVILATDGDFNIGINNRQELAEYIQENSKDKIFLTVLGLGQGNYKDHEMETIANKGNGNYFYLDTFNEAQKVLVNDLSGTLMTIAKDVKIQVEFNPNLVSQYRLIGYENRKMANKDFNDDKKDAGEIGAGHKVTAIYEIVPKGVPFHGTAEDSLKYQKTKSSSSHTGELLTVKLRYKLPEEDTSKLISVPVKDSEVIFEKASLDTKLAVSAASFGMILRGDKELGDANISFVLDNANLAKAIDKHGYRSEFVDLIKLAREIKSDKDLWK